MRESHTSVIERNVRWSRSFATEPYEAAWASEAIFFVRALESHGPVETTRAVVQISPDGMIWCDEGTEMSLPVAPDISFCRVRHFGGWLRLAGELPPEADLRVIVYLVLKG